MKRYAAVGLGSRSRIYTEALLTDHRAQGALVDYCDVNQTHMDYYNRLVSPVPVGTLGARARRSPALPGRSFAGPGAGPGSLHIGGDRRE